MLISKQLDKHTFPPAAFRKVQKIRKGLKSNGTSNIAGFFFIKKSIQETGRVALLWAFLCGLHFTPVSGPLLVGFLSWSSDTIRFSSLTHVLWESLWYICYFVIRIVLWIWHPLVYKIRKISTITLHITIFYWRAYSGTDLPWPCSCITHAAFVVFRHKISQYDVYLQLTCYMTFLHVKTRPAKSYSHGQIEKSFANLFDALVLLRLHFMIITSFQTTFSVLFSW